MCTQYFAKTVLGLIKSTTGKDTENGLRLILEENNENKYLMLSRETLLEVARRIGWRDRVGSVKFYIK